MAGIPKHSALIFMTGATILGIELAASRYMSPMFGSSLYIWGAILSITLICLSAGYSLGGRIGSNRPEPIKTLMLFAAISATWVGVLPFVHRPVAELALWAGPMMGPLVAFLFLFALPVLLLATATPIAFASNLREDHDEEGASKTIGDLFAISTLGSVAGALFTAYFLIPEFGLRATFFILSVILFATIAPYVFRGIYLRTTTNLVIIVALAQFMSDPSSGEGLREPFQFIYKTSSQYGEVAVVENKTDGSRILLLDGTTQNWLGGEDFGQSLFEHNVVINGQLDQYDIANRRALVLGLGAGAFTRDLIHRGFEVDSVEIDRKIVEVAQEFFQFPRELPVHVQDGRTYLEEAVSENRKYGVIILDISGGGSQPNHLFNLQAFQAISKLLSDDGVLVTNQLLTLAPSNNQLALHSLAALQKVFPVVRAFDCFPEEPDNHLTNMVVFSSQTAPRNKRFRSRINETMYEADVANVRPLSDDWNPSSRWSIDVNRQWHVNVINWLGPEAVIPL